MVRVTKGLLLVFVVCWVFPFQGSPVFARREVPTTLDPVTTVLPSYRIDDQMRKISIVGSGSDSEELQSVLTKLFIEKTDIKVVEPGNLRSVLAGKVIEYRTGIDPADAQTFSRMFQIDHLLLFDVEVAPYSAYRFGGKNYALINLKIVNTTNGEVLFQTSRNVGVRYDDPRKYGYPQISELDTPGLRYGAFLGLLYELRYALGDVSFGWQLKPGTDVVGTIVVGSAAERSGIQKGDTIVGINDTKISAEQDIFVFMSRNGIKQGDETVVRIERDGKTLEKRVRFSIIPSRPGKRLENEREPGVDGTSEERPKTRLF